jgi:threonine synthase
MRFYSTNNKNYTVGLEEAVRLGLPSDNGLFMPEEILHLPDSFFANLSSLNLAEIGFEVLQPYTHNAIPDNVLADICRDAFSFAAPLVSIGENILALELYHGPTLAFKDFGARFMARLLGHFNHHKTERTTILVATSGDTGSAVAAGFYQVENVDVVILYPQGKVSDLQEQQMTSLGGNIQVIAIDGAFDDCQNLVKAAFLDSELTKRYGLTSANSINIARLLPQMIYYFYAFGQVSDGQTPVVFSVPSGNFGNLTAGLLAKKMGLPIRHFIAATNVNEIVPQYLKTGNFAPKKSIETISNAMDVGNPSNFTRLQALFNNSLAEFRSEITGYSFSDNQTRETIKHLFNEFDYVADPHGAIGYRALSEYLDSRDATGVFLETAHPIKFKQDVEPLINSAITIPKSLSDVLLAEKKSPYGTTNFDEFKELLQSLLV